MMDMIIILILVMVEWMYTYVKMHQIVHFIFLIFIYLAALGLSCSMRDLQLRHVGSLVVACELLVVACGI